MPHTQGKCIIGAKAQKVPKFPERIDLYWDGDSKGCSLDHRCQHGTAVLAVACPFCGTKEKCGARQNADDAVDDGWLVDYRVPASEIPGGCFLRTPLGIPMLVGEDVSELCGVKVQRGSILGRAACDSEFANPLLETGSLHGE